MGCVLHGVCLGCVLHEGVSYMRVCPTWGVLCGVHCNRPSEAPSIS